MITIQCDMTHVSVWLSHGSMWYNLCLIVTCLNVTQCDMIHVSVWLSHDNVIWHICHMFQLLVRHSELEQSETKAQAALVMILSLTQITELKLLLDIGRQGNCIDICNTEDIICQYTYKLIIITKIILRLLPFNQHCFNPTRKIFFAIKSIANI